MKKIRLTDKEIEKVDNIELIDNKNKKSFKFIILVFSLIIIGIITYFIPKNNKLDDNDNYLKINENNLIKIKENELYGFIDVKGNKIIDFTYDEADDFIGNYAKVKKDKNFYLIDKNGKIIFEDDNGENIKYLDEYNIWLIKEDIYDYNMNKINSKNETIKYINYGFFLWNNTNNNTSGVMNYKGKKTYTYNKKEKDEILAINNISKDNNNYYCILNLNNEKYAIINCDSGKIIHEYDDKLISSNTNSYFEFKVKKDYSFVKKLIVINDKIVYSSEEKSDFVTDNNNYYTIYNKNTNKIFYIDKTNGKKVDSIPSNSNKNNEENEIEEYLKISRKKCDNKYELYEGKSLKLNCDWDDIYYFEIDVAKYLKNKNKYYVIGKKENEYFLIDYKKNKVIKKFQTDYISINNKSLFIEYRNANNNNKIVYSINKNKTIEFDEDNKIGLYSNYFIVKENGTINYYNIDLKKIYEIK